MYAITNLSLVPVRKEPSDKSEMVSQLLFGDIVEVIDTKENWRKIRMLFDDKKPNVKNDITNSQTEK